ncbi:DUF4123 domain-containing protein [Pseudomonas sp. S 311-6]|uniref:DUF4123 domain-containing protein n=1 Tax=Pseudomonas TaxID=286 RepID=UPI002096C312|nr:MULTISPECIES: DUF4123 domain-containing protein [Pseudomonas]MCO7641692.1 DUF4123 domain-containing protein [Pseudomonas sp. S 311-6]MCO7567123.1 DUF4123 domain-containing protein [Pseudomonas mosselii]MCO7596371.1 DUF4123 domain-containing protein [Pseudomonas guariconensis]MCO7618416.1 DUF4123 domain-containing protein [Pseudomonas guariconensis]MCU7219378.1 DUF4123 domain-containing protein [Pseudomonas brassicacearum]
MNDPYVDAGWPRQNVSTVPQPAWPLTDAEPAWLLINGDLEPRLPEDIRSLSGPCGYHWVWRGTAAEYAPPGYQTGPLLTRLNEPLLERFIHDWGPRQAGLMLFGPAQISPLLQQLRSITHLSSADDNSLAFHWSRPRTLEELCEALPSHYLSRLFSPIRSMLWHSGLEPDSWLRADIPANPSSSTLESPPLTLTVNDEAALNRASHAWFMRRTCHLMSQALSTLGEQLAPLNLRRQLAKFDKESDLCGFHLERDRRYYMELRLLFPEHPFVNDQPLFDLLVQSEIQGLQRLHEINDRLNQISAPIRPRNTP